MLKVGIVGLANVGKSTLFNTLAESEQAEIGNYPFTTIDPNTAIVEVPDKTLDKLALQLKVLQKIPATIEFVDIAGLIKGAHKGEGLGNQFLDQIRRMDALLIILRAFENKAVAFEPLLAPEQLEIIKEELRQKDRETLCKKTEELRHRARTDEKEDFKAQLLQRMIQAIDSKKDLFPLYKKLDKEEKKFIHSLSLLSLKPYLIVINVSEAEAGKVPESFGLSQAIIISAKTEKELNELDKKEQKEYLAILGLEDKALKRIIQEAYKLLDLITFYTYKPKELVQAWALKKGSFILQAAAKIHSDFAKSFIKAEVINASELLKFESLEKAGKKGKIRSKGKNYIVEQGDLIYIHHGQ